MRRSVIDGLYATGNTSASVMANEYAGAGATIGPSMVFGYVARTASPTATVSSASSDPARSSPEVSRNAHSVGLGTGSDVAEFQSR
ncbi:hypothetical protein GS455_21905 [Rhodococcus hoagii]|nr:hypothetical protein [Prescottella equi]